MKKFLSFTLVALFLAFAVNATTIYPISASSTTLCLGSPATAIDSTTGGTWSSSDVSVATVGSTGSITTITPVSAGSVTITYTVGSSYVTQFFTVSIPPDAITGTVTVCEGGTITLADATTGGSWGSYNPGIASVGASTGVVTGVLAGTTTIAYYVGSCSALVTVSVAPTSATVTPIYGDTVVCAGATITLTDATVGGTWVSDEPAIATVSSTGVVTGVASGTTLIDYIVPGSCGAAIASYYVSVTGAPYVFISGASSMYTGATTTFSASYTGGTWSSSNPSVASISTSGDVTGVATGTTTISYIYTNSCGLSDTATASITVSVFTGISGNVLFSGASYYGNVKVWLITYNPSSHLLEAIDSQTVYSSGSSAYYEFDGEPTDSFRIKANIIDSTVATTGYMPTYHTSNFYWHDATVLYHVSTVGDAGQDINMSYGTTATGPGFIAGDVTTGANRGTSTSVPAVGLHIYVINSTGVMVAQTYTDAAGHYSFSSLPLGTYTIFPEALQYITTALTSVTLTAGSPSVSTGNFVQHTLSFTITPMATGISNVTTATSSVIAFPNPTSGKLNIQWNEQSTEKATLTVADVAGRIVYSTSLNMEQGAGTHQLDLSDLGNGLYILSIKSASINYNKKVEIAK